jgi:hypothetical protein
LQPLLTFTISGDGRADLLWVDKFNGDTSVWYNNGEVANRLSGSKFSWDGVPTKAYQGSARGSTQYFPNIGGVGRADIVEVNPNTAYVSYSSYLLLSLTSLFH